MSFTLTCEKGDSMPKIAAEHGFADYQTIWQLPENAELHKHRPNPNVLAAGDRVFIPDKQDKVLAAGTGAKHRYKLKGKPTRLRLKLVDLAGTPLKQAQVQITIDGKTTSVTTDGDGVLEQVVPPGAPTATLTADALGTLEIQIGHLDPIEHRSGLVGRLRNLGYVPTTDEVDVRDDVLHFGVELFQADARLPIDGSDTSSIEGKLKDVYGC